VRFLVLNKLDGHTLETNVKPCVALSPGSSQIELCFEQDELLELRVDGVPTEIVSGLILDVPATKPSLSLSGRTSDGGYFSTEFLNDAYQQLKRELLEDLADFHVRLKHLSESGEVTFGQLATALDKGQLSLLVRPHVMTDLQADHHLNRIIAALPALQRVVHGPRRHLRIDEAIRPVAVVRRTGPAALRHLSQHSEHWECRTVAGLRPARLLAKVVDDDLDLYENRFVVTLIKVLHRRLARLVFTVDTALTQAQSAFEIGCYAEELKDVQSQRLLNALLPKADTTDVLQDVYLFEGYKKKIDYVLHTLTECEESSLFRSVRSAAPVQEPILPTNILTMDPHYRILFDLWHELNQLLPEKEGTGELPADLDLGSPLSAGYWYSLH
jgi:hypothetical protein